MKASKTSKNLAAFDLSQKHSRLANGRYEEEPRVLTQAKSVNKLHARMRDSTENLDLPDVAKGRNTYTKHRPAEIESGSKFKGSYPKFV